MLTTKHAGAEILLIPAAAAALLAYAFYRDGQIEKKEKEAARAPGTPGVDHGAGF